MLLGDQDCVDDVLSGPTGASSDRNFDHDKYHFEFESLVLGQPHFAK